MRKQSETTIDDMKIYVKNNDVGKALRIMKKKMLAEGLGKELRDRRFFRSKGEERRLAEKAGRKRWEKKRAQLEQKFIQASLKGAKSGPLMDSVTLSNSG